MAKFLASSVLDAALNVLKNTATEMYFCAGQPATRAAAISTAAGPAIALTTADFTLSTPGAGQRAVTIAAKSETANAAVTADHIALSDGTNILFVDTVATAQNSNVGAAISDGAITLTLGAIA